MFCWFFPGKVQYHHLGQLNNPQPAADARLIFTRSRPQDVHRLPWDLKASNSTARLALLRCQNGLPFFRRGRFRFWSPKAPCDLQKVSANLPMKCPMTGPSKCKNPSWRQRLPSRLLWSSVRIITLLCHPKKTCCNSTNQLTFFILFSWPPGPSFATQVPVAK